ncbi:MAG: NTP transferase domain-containing protein [Fuerstiella sp.]|nr:NTP transferase domain-containing protein [Fuerstiella sp.]
MTAPIAVVLAAGKSTRMKSATPKVLHPVCGQLMIDYVLNAVRAAGVEKIIVVVGHKAAEVRSAMSVHDDVVFAEQTEQHGTGHAVMMCESELTGHDGSVIVLAGDTPLLQSRSLIALLNHQQTHSAACVIGTADTTVNDGLGRVVRDADGTFVCIREQKDASDEERNITEVNTGCYAFSTPRLLESLERLKPNNVQAEYYLTDCPRILMDDGHHVAACCSLTIEEAIGVNNRIQLAEVRNHIQRGILQELMLSGVTIEDPNQTSIDCEVEIGSDSLIRPGTVIDRGARIGAKCRIGPNVHITQSQTVADGAVLGPR